MEMPKPIPEPKYCKKCGTKLVSDQRITGYNEQTGEAIRPFTHLKACPWCVRIQ